MGDILELYPVDNRYTMKTEEFVTELQIRVKERNQKRMKKQPSVG